MKTKKQIESILKDGSKNPYDAVADYTLRLIYDYKQFCENNPITRFREQYNRNVQGIQETCAIFDLAWHPFVRMYEVGVMSED